MYFLHKEEKAIANQPKVRLLFLQEINGRVRFTPHVRGCILDTIFELSNKDGVTSQKATAVDDAQLEYGAQPMHLAMSIIMDMGTSSTLLILRSVSVPLLLVGNGSLISLTSICR